MTDILVRVVDAYVFRKIEGDIRFLILKSKSSPIISKKIAAENPILWLPLTKVSVLTNTGPRNEVSFPEVANRPKPLL